MIFSIPNHSAASTLLESRNENEHPMRAMLEHEVGRQTHPLQTTIPPYPPASAARSGDLEEIIMRQLRPRTFSLLFGQDRFHHQPTAPSAGTASDIQTMETVMNRLRRQLRNSTTRSAQDAALAHRSVRATEESSRESTPREQLERLRGARRERLRGDNLLFHQTHSRWNSFQTSDLDLLHPTAMNIDDWETQDRDREWSQPRTAGREALERRLEALIRSPLPFDSISEASQPLADGDAEWSRNQATIPRNGTGE
ncbi:hypothetical protein HDV03_000045 [Kappamyces sp. JEL0829]|nr:hypothetical protein HDV03_000045 [Kappamyces sp. JEL0829]KAJ3349789.1 hypothetical protein HDU91_006338 [Kappamyces sp. JEL0680]